MSVKELEQQVKALPPAELSRFCQWLNSYLGQALDALSEEGPEHLTAQQKSELLRRVEFAKTHPEALTPWEGTTDRIRQNLHDLQAQKSTRSRS